MLNYKFLIIVFATLIVSPAFGQQMPNDSLSMAKFDIPWNEFNIPARDSVIVPFDEIHETNWEVNLQNRILYGNPEGTAVVRLHDANVEDKFIEIGMGGIPNRPFWVAVQLPEEGYVVVHNKLDRGWPGHSKVILSYSDTAGLTINNGERIVITNLDVEGFAIKAYSVWGMKGSQDPPATTDGYINFEVISGDPKDGPLHMFPFYLVGALGCVVAFLLFTKKRN